VLGRRSLYCIVHDAEFTGAIARSGFTVTTVLAESFDELIASSADRYRVPLHGWKVVLLTSGTTGVPKGATRTARFKAVAGPLRTLLSRVPFRAGRPILVAPPLFHGMGFAYLNLALLLGSPVFLRRRFDPEAVLADVTRHGVRVLIAVPAMLRRLLDVPELV
jgi:fatty-acyl-CoA synthase